MKSLLLNFTATSSGRQTHWLHRVSMILVTVLVVLPILALLMLRFIRVPGTPQMLISLIEGRGARYDWLDESAMPSQLVRAAIASEDQKFCFHHGFDWSSIDEALRTHERGGRLRGASTISQQTARSLFLLPVRSWIRKGLEAWLTVLEEALWPKRRILTVYLNIIDWGNGNFGAEAAARAYFHRSAAGLTASQAARLVAVLPDPDDWRASRPGPYLTARAGVVRVRMAEVRRDGLESCLKP